MVNQVKLHRQSSSGWIRNRLEIFNKTISPEVDAFSVPSLDNKRPPTAIGGWFFRDGTWKGVFSESVFKSS
ncbi:hypothetical protein pipiens_018388 [Culex pipiens pipiens]|uniref:Uncharacterized protein n=1 Tax=Culex pipiens pipiens TaxID=38569 RepID=A0ABD1CBZ8_CULPP